MSLNGEENVETGNKKTSYGIKVNNFKINFPKGVPNFENYDTISESKKIKIFSNFYFPIEFTKTTYTELTKTQVTYTEEEAKQILVTKLEEELKQQVQDEEKIVNTQINYKIEGETLEVEMIYEVLENIGTNEKILF
jgi:similar to stage IV sporulation protein